MSRGLSRDEALLLIVRQDHFSVLNTFPKMVQKNTWRNLSERIQTRGSASLRAKARLSIALTSRVLHDLAFFHHEGDTFGGGDVGGGIAWHGDDVGELAFFQGADFLRDA